MCFCLDSVLSIRVSLDRAQDRATGARVAVVSARAVWAPQALLWRDRCSSGALVSSASFLQMNHPPFRADSGGETLLELPRRESSCLGPVPSERRRSVPRAGPSSLTLNGEQEVLLA